MADTSLSEKKIGLLVWQVSNYWQSKLRKILKKYKLNLNEYLIFEAINILNQSRSDLSQINIAKYSGIDISVTSVTLKLLEQKKLITRFYKTNNRSKNIEISTSGEKLIKEVMPLILNEEKNIFGKLQNEENNFTNSLKLLIGKTIRIKANKL